MAGPSFSTAVGEPRHGRKSEGAEHCSAPDAKSTAEGILALATERAFHQRAAR